MTNVGSVELSIRLAKEQLTKDIAAAQQLLTQLSNEEYVVGFDASAAKAGLNDLTGASNALGSSIAGDTVALQTLADVAKKSFAAVVGVAQQGVKDFLAFDNAIKQSGVVSQSTGTEQLQALRSEVERLGIVTSKAPAEIAQTTVALSRAGFAAAESTAAIEGIVRASEASGESLGVAGDIIAKTTRTFSLAASESGRVADILVATANNTNTSISGIGESLQYVGSVAAAANQPLEDITVLIGLLGDVGIQGSQAGTNLAAALEQLKIASAASSSGYAELARGSKRAAEAFAVIGAEVRNTDGSMKSMLEVLPAIQNNLDGLSQQDKDLLFKTLFGVEGGRAFQALLNVTPERLQLVTDKIRDSGGAAQKAGEEMLGGLGGALDLLGGSVGAASAKFGEFAAGGLEPAVRAAINLINGFLALPAPIQKVIIATSGLAAVLVGAIAVMTTFELLQVRTKTLQVAAIALTQARTAATAINTGVSAANVAVTNLMNTSISKENVLKAIATAKTLTLAAAQQVHAIATGQASAASIAFAGNLLKLGAQMALAAAAAYAVSEAFKRTDGVKFAQQIDQQIEGLDKFRAELGKTQQAAEEFSQTRYFDVAAQKGAAEAIRTALVDIQQAFLGGASAADTYGNAVGFVTAQQISNQRAVLAAEKIAESTNAALEEGIALLTKYGLATLEASDKTRLGTQGIAAFKNEAGEQVQVIDKTIEALKAQKAPSEEAQALINNQVKLLENQKGVIQKRILALESDTAATKANAEAQKAQQLSLEDVTKEYEKNTVAIEIAADKRRLALAQSSGNSRDSQKQAAVIEQDAIKKRIQANEEAAKKLKAVQVGASEEDVSKINEALLKNEQENIRLKIQAAESVNREKQRLNQQALQDEQNTATAATAAVTNAEKNKITAIRALQARGGVTPEGAAIRIAKVRQETITEEIRLEQGKLTRIRQLRSQGILDADKAAQDELSITSRLSDLKLQKVDQEVEARKVANQLKLQQVQQEVEAREAANRKIIAGLERANTQIEASIKRSQTERTTAIKQQLLAATVPGGDLAAAERDAQAASLKIQEEGVQAELALARKKLEETKSLRRQGVLSVEEATARELALQQQIADGNSQLVDLELANQKRLRDEAIRIVQERMESDKLRSEAAIANLEAEKRRLSEFTAKQDETLRNLLESRGNLQKALADAQLTTTQIQIDQFDQALSIRGKLDQADVDPRVKAELERQLGQLGLRASTSELQILQQKDALEKQLARQKFEALQKEQELARQMLELDLRRQDFAARQVFFEAKIAEQKARQNEQAAKGALQAAQVEGDQAKIAAAQQAVTNAATERELAAEGLSLAKEALSIQDELFANARKAQAAKQQSALAQFGATEASRQNANALAVAESAAKEIAKANQINTSAATPDQSQRLQIGSDLSRLGGAQNARLANVNPLNQQGPAAVIQSLGGDLATSLRTAVGGIEQRLDVLRQTLERAIASPRTLHVSTPQAVSDAAKIMNEVSSLGLMAAGG